MPNLSDNRLLRSRPILVNRHAGFTLVEKLIIVSVVGILGTITAPNFATLLNRMKLEEAVTEIRSALDETQRQAVRDNKICSVTLNLVEGQVTGDCLITGSRTLPTEIAIATNLINPSDSDSVASITQDPIASDVNSNLVADSGNPTQVALAPQRGKAPKAPKATVLIQIISAAGGNCKSQGKGIKHCDDDTFTPSGEPRVTTTTVPIQFGVLGNANFEVATNVDGLPADPTGKIVLHLPTNTKVERKCVAISNTLGLTRIGKYTGSLDPADITDSGVCTAINWEEQ